MFMQNKKNLEKELLDMNLDNIANELTELVIDKKSQASKIKKQAQFFQNFRAHVGVQYDGVSTEKTCSLPSVNETTKCVYNERRREDAENACPTFKVAKLTECQKPFSRATEFKRRSSAADADNIAIRFGDAESKIQANFANRRASVTDGELFGFDFESAIVAKNMEVPMAKSEQIADRSGTHVFCQAKNEQFKSAFNANRTPFATTINQRLSCAFCTNLQPDCDTQKFGNLNRRGSAADVEGVNFRFNADAEDLYLKAPCYKRRASAADVEFLSKNHETFQKPTALLNVVASVPRYWHVGPEVNTTGARKKFIQTKQVAEENKSIENLAIDLKAIGFNTYGKESNEVIRLFDLIHKVNVHLNDVVSTLQTTVFTNEYPTHFEEPKSIMPRTMNIRTHIKHIIYKCNGFCHDKSKQLDEYHCADREKYFECSRSIYVLRKLTKQLEAFKTADFEHRKGVFVNSFAAAKAKNLEILLAQMIDKIRECNNFVEVYRLGIQKNIKETGLTSLETLQKAVAIAAAMKTEIPKVNINSNEDEGGAWSTAATVTKPHQVYNFEKNNNKNSVESNDDYAALTETEIANSRNILRFVGTVI